MTCGSRRKLIKRHHKAVARSQQLLVSKLWKSQKKNSATFPVALHSIMLPRGHGTWMQRALGAGFQCLFQNNYDR